MAEPRNWSLQRVTTTAPMVKLVSFYQFMIGAGVTSGLSAITTASDWFNIVFPGYNTNFLFFILFFLPSLFVMPMMIACGDRISFKIRLIWSMIISAVIIAIWPAIIRFTPTITALVISSIFVFILGFFAGVTKASYKGIGSCLPKQYNRIGLMGQNFGGICINVLRIIWLASFPLTKDGLANSTQLYFAFCGVFFLVSALCVKLILQYKYVQYRLKRGDLKERARRESVKLSRMSESVLDRNNPSVISRQQTPAPVRQDSAVSVNAPSAPTAPLLDPKPAGPQRTPTYFQGKEIQPTTSNQFWKDVWPYVFLTGLNGLITKMIYPALAIKVDTKGIGYSWFVVTFITANNVASLGGRFITSWWDASLRSMFIMTIFRSVWLPITMTFTALTDPKIAPDALWKSLWFIYLNNIFQGGSLGLINTVVSTMAPTAVHYLWKSRAGYAMTAASRYMSFVGTLAALAFINVGDTPDSD